MNISDEKFLQLKKEVEQSRAEAERAKGALDQLTDRLRKEFGCSSWKEARSKLKKLEAQRDDLEVHFNELLSKYESKWKDRSK